MFFARPAHYLFVFLVSFFAVFHAKIAAAVEIYSIVTKDCERANGPIVYVHDNDVSVLTYKGRIVRIPRDEISIISRYQVQQSPGVSRVRADDPIIFQGQVQGDAAVFDAFAIGFVENLVLFLDQKGRIRVIELEAVNALKVKAGSIEAGTSGEVRASHAEPVLAASGFDSCHGGHAKTGAVATSDISDPFRVKIFLDRMRQGYRDLENLAERTQFYARPLLFDRKNRLGIATHGDIQKRISGYPSGAPYPIYFETGGGAPYRFQSSFAVGSFIPRMSPDSAPLFAIRSDFKSHLIHGSFVGNLFGLTAGKRLFLPSSRGFSKEPSPDSEPWVFSRYNHLTLLGADYGRLAVSYGYYFPVFAFGYGTTTLEARPPDASPVFHVGYTSHNWKIEGLTYLTSFRDKYPDLDLVSGKVSTEYEESTVAWNSKSIRPFKLSIQSQTLKVLTTYDGFPQAMLGFDAAVSRTHVVVNSYPFASEESDESEKTPLLDATRTDKISSSRVELNAFVRKDLGRSVALRGEVAAYYESLDFKAESSKSRSLNRKLWNYLVALELLL